MKNPTLALAAILALGGPAAAETVKLGEDAHKLSTNNPPTGKPALEDAAKVEDAYKRYVQAYCGAAEATDACKGKYAEGFGKVLERWGRLCPESGKAAEGDKDALDRFSEGCPVRMKLKTALLSKEDWANTPHGKAESRLLQELASLEALQKGHEASAKLLNALEKQTFTKEQFEDELKRRTEKLTPLYAGQDPKFRVVNLIFLYHGDAAREKLIGDGKKGKHGSNANGGKLAFLERAEKVGLANLSDEDKKKFLGADALNQVAKAEESGKEAKKQREAAEKKLKDDMKALADGTKADPGGAAPAAGASAGFWSGERVSAAQLAEQQSKVKAAQTPKNFKEKKPEPPAAKKDEEPKAPEDGCRSLLGWKCAVRELRQAAGAIRSFAGKAKHKIVEGVMIGAPSAKEKDKAAKEAEGKPANGGKKDKDGGKKEPAVTPLKAARDEAAAEAVAAQRDATRAADFAEKAQVSAAKATVEKGAALESARLARTAADAAAQFAAQAQEHSAAAAAESDPVKAKQSAVAAAGAAKKAVEKRDAAMVQEQNATATAALVEVAYDWGREVKNGSQKIVEVGWKAGRGSYIKLRGGKGEIVPEASQYVVKPGSELEYKEPGGGAMCLTVAGDVKVLRTRGGAQVVGATGAQVCK